MLRPGTGHRPHPAPSRIRFRVVARFRAIAVSRTCVRSDIHQPLAGVHRASAENLTGSSLSMGRSGHPRVATALIADAIDSTRLLCIKIQRLLHFDETRVSSLLARPRVRVTHPRSHLGSGGFRRRGVEEVALDGLRVVASTQGSERRPRWSSMVMTAFGTAPPGRLDLHPRGLVGDLENSMSA